MKRTMLLLVAALMATVAVAAEKAVVVAVKPHYVKASCEGCNLPQHMGYNVWWEYKNTIRTDRMDIRPAVGDIYEVRNGQLGKLISRASDYRSRFPGDTSGN